jgi:hypothetical protein
MTVPMSGERLLLSSWFVIYAALWLWMLERVS